MEISSSIARKAHFLGSKVRSLRKQSGLTLEDLSVRCIQIDARAAPSVSYISLIETGKRIPSEELLKLFAEIFQKDINWFLDDNLTVKIPKMEKTGGAVQSFSLEPKFLFSDNLLQTSIPELLSQTGTNGRQFAHILIRSYQEKHQNQFPDIERAAEEIGQKRFPLSIRDILDLYKKVGLKVKYFDRPPFVTENDSGHKIRTLFRSFFEPPHTVVLNRQLEQEPRRMKYDLSAYLGHKVLHNGDGLVSSHATGGELGGSPQPDSQSDDKVSQSDILYAWRNFECSFFAGALLCPRLPFRHYLAREAHHIHAFEKIDITAGVYMRRMTSVSPYKYWHYFDAFQPGFLRAVYRGNGIPMPWGNMRMGMDPCRQWAVFRLLDNSKKQKPLHQISLLMSGNNLRLYACVSQRVHDAAKNSHVISTGIDLMPALENQGINTQEICELIRDAYFNKGHDKLIPQEAREYINLVAKILNISWVAEGLKNPVQIICPRSSNCPKDKHCENQPKHRKKVSWLNEIKQEVLTELK